MTMKVHGSGVLNSISLFIAIFISLQNVAIAQSAVTVSIRAIQAYKNDAVKKPTGLNDSSIRDIKAKLKKLHYNQFSLVSQQSKEVSLDSKDTFRLEDGHIISFRPVSKKRDKICLWFNWKDSKGMNILDTRMHFKDGETVITGYDSSDDTGLILAVDVK